MYQYDVIVVGGGLAGLMTALGIAGRRRVALLSKVHPLRSHSLAAQGGINAALGNTPDGANDSWEKHAFDTIKGGDYLADQDAVETLCRRAPETVYELEHWGAPFSRTPDGRIAQRPFGGAGHPRTCYAADRTGHVLLHTLYERAQRQGLIVHSEWLVTSLAIKEGAVQGVIALPYETGAVSVFAAPIVVFATGGYGRVYRNSTNALINTGDGIALAYQSGIPIKDLEFVQFHPTTLFGSNILITEGARGEGGRLINRHGERFMRRYAEKLMELAPRDIVARGMATEISEGHGHDGAYLHLDLRHLGAARIKQRLPAIREIAMDFAGVDPVKDLVPVQPGQHYSMGGIDTNSCGETAVRGFYAAGECACVSVHGANRLGGNSLLETLVFGKVVAERLAETAIDRFPEPDASFLDSALQREKTRLQNLLERSGKILFAVIRDELRNVMTEKAGIYRDESGLKAALDAVRALKRKYENVGIRNKSSFFNFELINVIELQGMLDLSEIIVAGALNRQESRGSHFRTDYPKRDDAKWLKHTLARHTPEGPRLDFKEVTITRHAPQERTY